MIEVEKKFNLTEKEKQRLLEQATFISEKQFTDAYYDTKSFDLMKKNWWLRARDGMFNIKLPIESNEKRSMDIYDEVEDEQKIRSCLQLPSDGDLNEVLAREGYAPVLSFRTIRQTYRDGVFRIDVDEAQYSDGNSYRLAEIELLADTPEDAARAAHAITEFAQKKKMTLKPVHGKVLHYLSLTQQDVYRQILQSAFRGNNLNVK